MTSKHWVVTGASRGIGLQLVTELLKTDEQVTALARHSDKAAALQELLRTHPARLRVFEADVTKEFELDRAVKALENRKVDILINNAGVYKDKGGIKDFDFKIAEQTLIVNTLGPMSVTKAFLPLLNLSSHPTVANITSLMGSISDNTSGGSYAYRMSKSALNMFTKSLAIEFPKMTVLSLHPGWVQTDMGGAGATVERATSAAGLIKVIREAASEKSGHFFDFRGQSLSW